MLHNISYRPQFQKTANCGSVDHLYMMVTDIWILEFQGLILLDTTMRLLGIESAAAGNSKPRYRMR